MGLRFGCSTIVVVFSLISLAFLIIANVTAPATTVLALAEEDGLKYGVFGYCDTNSTSSCVTGSPSYDVTGITSLSDWLMDDNARSILSKILIVAPIAGGLTLFSFLFNLFAHIRVFGESTAFYVVGFIFTLLAFLATALTVIVVFLLFYPHVQWPAWILIGAGVLNLLSVPLVFFAMRTSSSSSDDDDDDADDKNLTDLSDGTNYKNAESFTLNNLPPQTYAQSSTEKFHANEPAIKVITDDSSLSGSHFEKVSMHDYSRGSNGSQQPANYDVANPYRGYNNYQPTTTQPPSASAGYSEGTPNLVSSQNYTRGGAVRTEVPSFQPQSAKPEFGGNTAAPPSSSVYPSAQYGSASYNSLTSQNNENVAPPMSTGYDSSGDHTSPYPHSVFPTTTESNPMGSSMVPEDVGYENDINDNDSDFTSVSQRAANPRYYRGFQQQQPQGPSLFPNGVPPQQQPRAQHSLGHQQQQQQQQQHPQHMSYNSAGYSPQQYQQPQFQSPYSQPPTAPAQASPVRDTSAYLLAQNPDFSVGGAASLGSKKSTPTPLGSAGGYRPAYKKRIHSGNKMAAASLSNDSPYNFR